MKPDPPVDSPVLTVRQACAYLQRGRSWMLSHADAIGVIRDGGRLAFKRARLDAWLDRHETQPAAPAVEPAPTPIRRGIDTSKLGPTNPVTGKAWNATLPREVSR